MKYVGGSLLFIGSGALFVWPELFSCPLPQKNFRRQDHRAAYQDNDVNLILYLASLAPSGHNTQPWMVEIITDQYWLIRAAVDRRLSAVDGENREMLLSLGAFIENLCLAAKNLGYESQITIEAKAASDSVIAAVRLETDGKKENLNMENLILRRTLRGEFNGQAIPEAILADWLQPEQGAVCYVPVTSTAAQYLREGTIQANIQQNFREDAQQELAAWIRWSDLEAQEKRTGLTPESMEIEGLSCWYVKHFYGPQDVLTQDFRKAAIEKVKKEVNSCGGWLLIYSRNSSVDELIQAGRRLERLWIQARGKSIAIQPMTQMLEEDPWKSVINGQLGISGQLQFILRIGYVSKYPDPVSIRLPVSAFVL